MHPNFLDQIIVFQAVAELGSYAEAARRLNRQVSAISYAITNLETHLGLTLVDRGGYRAGLTEEGQALLGEVSVLLRRVERLEGKAAAMREASETTLSLAVEHSLPPAVLAWGLARLADAHPEVAVDLSYLTGGDVIARLTGGEVQLGITALERGLAWQDLDGRQVLAEEMPVVVGARHALAARNAPVPLEALEHHRQIYLPSGLPPTDENTRPDYRQHRTDLWHVNDLATQIALIAGGAGWGFVPASAAAEAVAQGRLAYLACDGIAQLPLRRFAALWRTRTPPGPAARFLMQVLEAGGNGTLEAP